MECVTLCELRQKEVINICTGCRLGCICDLEINQEDGVIRAIIVPGPPRFWGLLRGVDEIVIPYGQIRKIGSDVILVEVP